MKKKRFLIILLILLLIGGAGAGFWFFKGREMFAGETDDNIAFVDNVGVLTGLAESGGSLNRFAGVVEPQKTVGIEVASGMKVKQTFVSVGDQVEIGTKLFSYDTDEAQDSITQLEIDIETEEIAIDSANAQIKQLEKEKEKAKTEDNRLSITTQIMTTENAIKRSEYTIKSKKAEMESLKKQVANAYVYSDQQGIVKTINKNNSGRDDTEGSDMSAGEENSSAYITIMATGDYRIKGKINEQNISQLNIGGPVIVHSRVDDSIIWRGTLTSIDKDNHSLNNANSWGGDSNSLTSSSYYPFYVDMDDSTGLMLGQHVYIVRDEGQEDEKEGMWLDESYFILDEDYAVTPFVWAQNAEGKLEKRKVTFGEYDDDMMAYEIIDGLTVDDYIAFPSEDLTEGMRTEQNVDNYDYEDGLNDDYSYEDFSDDADLGDEADWSDDEDDWSDDEVYDEEENFSGSASFSQGSIGEFDLPDVYVDSED